MPAAPHQAMRTVGVKIPMVIWERLNQIVLAERNAHPSRKFTISDAIRERLCISINQK